MFEFFKNDNEGLLTIKANSHDQAFNIAYDLLVKKYYDEILCKDENGKVVAFLLPPF